jgi:anti-sigma regulatory factor (Ser/Thr protein kinase)
VTVIAPVVHELRYPGSLEKIGLVRADLAGFLGACPVLDDARMVVSELAANAVLHSRSCDSTFTVRAEIGSARLRIEVSDNGGTWDPRRQYIDDRPHGLKIVAAICGHRRWGFEGDHNGRTVWALLTWEDCASE